MAIGAQLAAARSAAGLTLSDVSRSTCIRVEVLAGIEADDFSRCRGSSYARGHIRTYAGAVGLDPEALLREFAGAAPIGDASRTGPVLPVPEKEPVTGSVRGPLFLIALLALVLVLAWVVSGPSPAPASPVPIGVLSLTGPLGMPPAS